MWNTGGLAKNTILMQLIADCCKMPVQLPFSSSASVVLGSAMLGAIAHREVERDGQITTQDQAEKRSQGMREELWSCMVCCYICTLAREYGLTGQLQTKMSRPGKTVKPKAGDKEQKLLEVKWSVFNQSIELQRKIRKDVAEALA